MGTHTMTPRHLPTLTTGTRASITEATMAPARCHPRLPITAPDPPVPHTTEAAAPGPLAQAAVRMWPSTNIKAAADLAAVVPVVVAAGATNRSRVEVVAADRSSHPRKRSLNSS